MSVHEMIKPPGAPDYPDRQFDCEVALYDSFRTMIADARSAGWTPDEIDGAILSLVINERRSLTELAKVEADIGLVRVLVEHNKTRR